MKVVFYSRPVPYPDSYWQAVKHQYGAASIYTAQMQSKGTSVGTLTVGSVSPNAFAGCEGSQRSSLYISARGALH